MQNFPSENINFSTIAVQQNFPKRNLFFASGIIRARAILTHLSSICILARMRLQRSESW